MRVITPALDPLLGGWRGAVGAWAVVSLAALILWLLGVRHGDAPEGPAPTPQRPSTLLRSPIAWAVILCIAGYSTHLSQTHACPDELDGYPAQPRHPGVRTTPPLAIGLDPRADRIHAGRRPRVGSGPDGCTVGLDGAPRNRHNHPPLALDVFALRSRVPARRRHCRRWPRASTTAKPRLVAGASGPTERCGVTPSTLWSALGDRHSVSSKSLRPNRRPSRPTPSTP